MVDKNDLERMKAIAANITQLREAQGLTQKELAEALGITPGALTQWIQLRNAPSFGMIQKLADYFGVKKSQIDSAFAESSESYDLDLESQLEGAEAFGGKPMSENDKEIIKGLISSYMETKYKDR